MDIVKVCKKHGNLIDEQVRRRKNRKELICKLCESERHRQWIENDRKKASERALKYRFIEREITTKELTCSRCRLTKSLEFFNKYMFNIRYPYCLECRRNATNKYRNKNESKLKHREYYKTKYERTAENNRLKKMYGITLENYDRVLESQNYECAICHRPESKTNCAKRISRLSVDHDHSDGSIRGLLCKACNSGLGHFQDNKEILRNALEYLSFHNES